MLECLLSISAWDAVSDNLQIDFPTLWTPTAKEVAEIAKSKAEAIISTYQAGLLNVDTAQKELKKLAGETGMFDSITDEGIQSNAGKTFQDATALRDPLVGLGYGEEEATGAFEGGAQDTAVRDYSPSQPRDKSGRWTSGSGKGKIGKTKYAPSSQRSHSGIQLNPKTYARLTSTLNTRFPGLEKGEIRNFKDAKYIYRIKADGSDGFELLGKWKI